MEPECDSKTEKPMLVELKKRKNILGWSNLILTSIYMIITAFILINSNKTLKFYQNQEFTSNRPMLMPDESNFIIEIDSLKDNQLKVVFPIKNYGKLPAYNITTSVIPHELKKLTNYYIAKSEVASFCAPNATIFDHKFLPVKIDYSLIPENVKEIRLTDGSVIKKGLNLYIHVFIQYTTSGTPVKYPYYHTFMASYLLSEKGLNHLGANELFNVETKTDTIITIFNPPNDFRFAKSRFKDE